MRVYRKKNAVKSVSTIEGRSNSVYYLCSKIHDYVIMFEKQLRKTLVITQID